MAGAERGASGARRKGCGAVSAALMFLRRQAFAIAIILCALSACIWPWLYDAWFGVKLMPFVGPSIQLIMFGMGTTLTAKDFAGVVKSPWSVAVGAVLQFSVMPFAALLVARILGFEGELAAGMVLIGSVAGGMASNVIAYLARANVALSVTMTCVSTLLSPFVTPLLMKSLAGTFVEIDAVRMMIEMIKIVIIPVGAGYLVRTALGRRYETHKRPIDAVLQAIAMFGICFSLVVCVAPNSEKLKAAGVVILLSSVLHTAIGYSLGYWISRLLGLFLPIDERDARTVAIEVGMQNGGMAAALAVNVLGSSVAALPANAAAVWMNLSGSMLANYWNKRPPKGAKGEDR